LRSADRAACGGVCEGISTLRSLLNDGGSVFAFHSISPVSGRVIDPTLEECCGFPPFPQRARKGWGTQIRRIQGRINSFPPQPCRLPKPSKKIRRIYRPDQRCPSFAQSSLASPLRSQTT
jgi:hypothetical protein